MKLEDKLKDNALNMKMEYQVSNRKINRSIDAIFESELEHFKQLFISFNSAYNCVSYTQVNDIFKQVENIFDDSKVLLVDKYKAKFNKNVDGLVSTMYDFFIRKSVTPNIKPPHKELDKYLMELCKFECFLFENKLEDDLIDFTDDFVYRYINSEEQRKDFIHLMKNINHSLVCEMKKAISNSIEDKQEIALRYNRLNKELLSHKKEL